jgi:TonB family protein
VVAAAFSKDIPFPVPVPGVTALVPPRFAPPPPLNLTPPPAPPPPPEIKRERFRPNVTAKGSFPEIRYVSGTLPTGTTAVLEVLIDVNADGTVETVDIEKSTGSIELDRKTVQHIRSRWRWEPGEARKYSYEITFQVR